MSAFFQKVWEILRSFLFDNLTKIITFAVVLILGFIAIKIATAVFQKIMRKSRLNGAAGDFLTSLVRLLLLAVYFIALLALLGIPTTSLIALFSACALAVSLSLQNTFSNVASGFVIVANKPFEVGNYVDIDGTTGTVQTITIFNTKLKTPDNKIVVLPNGTVAAANITNYSTLPTRRLDLTFSVAYGTDLEKVKTVILGVIEKHDNILKDPAPMVRLTEHNEHSLDFIARVWVEQAEYWPVSFALKEEVYNAFAENGITIPFQQLDVHVISDKK